MKKKKSVFIVAGVVLALLLAGVGIAVFFGGAKEPSDAAQEKTGLGQDYEYEIFQAVPALEKEDISYTQADYVGGGDYMITVPDTALSDYQGYLSTLEKNGFEKRLDNGENGIEGFVYTAHYQKDELLLIVTYITNLKELTITATEDAQLSPHLFYDASYISGNKAGAKTTFSLLELETAGNSFVIQMKDGHFLVFDGGQREEAPHLLDYLESLTPEGEKPVVDAWFFSHSHTDHMGTLIPLSSNKEYAERIYVESVYYDFPSDEQINEGGRGETPNSQILYIKTVQDYLKSTDGSGPKLYQPRLGERYYFSDFTIDIIYTQELLPPEEWDTWNASSAVMMLTIEGQKVLLTGDSDWCSQLVWTDMFDKNYFDLDIYQVPHHGINVYKQITNRLGKIHTAIWPTKQTGTTFGAGSFLARKVQNVHLVSVAEEALSWGEGTVVLTFPYEIGSAKILPKQFNLEG